MKIESFNKAQAIHDRIRELEIAKASTVRVKKGIDTYITVTRSNAGQDTLKSVADLLSKSYDERIKELKEEFDKL